MTHPLPTQPEVPDAFDGTAYLVSEIGDALTNARYTLESLEFARIGCSISGMNRHHMELDKLLGQSRLLSESLGRVIQFHVNRRKAQS